MRGDITHNVNDERWRIYFFGIQCSCINGGCLHEHHIFSFLAHWNRYMRKFLYHASLMDHLLLCSLNVVFVLALNGRPYGMHDNWLLLRFYTTRAKATIVSYSVNAILIFPYVFQFVLLQFSSLIQLKKKHTHTQTLSQPNDNYKVTLWILEHMKYLLLMFMLCILCFFKK